MSAWLTELPTGVVVQEESYAQTAMAIGASAYLRRDCVRRRTEYRGITLATARANDTPVIIEDWSQTTFETRAIVAGGYVLTKIEDIPVGEWITITYPAT